MREGRPGRSVVVWGILGALVLTIAVLEYRDRGHDAGLGPETDARRLLPERVEQLAAVEIANRGRLHRFERTTTGAWFYHGAPVVAAWTP